MLELAAVILVAAISTSFALDILRPTMKLVTRRRSSGDRIRVADAEASH